MSTSSSWSDLPSDLIAAISTRLPTYADYLRFRSISHHFHTSTSPTPTHLPPQLPWLLLPHSHPATSSTPLRRAFFNLSLNKFHFLPFLNPSNPKRCCGSSHGWLVILEEHPTITLLNALTAQRVALPPLYTFPNVQSLDFSNVGREYTIVIKSGVSYTCNLSNMRDMFVKKIVLSGSPMNGDFIAVAILSQLGELGYCKEGDESWGIVDGVEGCEDVIYFNGLFYAVNKNGIVTVCDLSERNNPKVSVVEAARQEGGDVHYLVGFDEGLYFVSRYLDMVYDEALDQVDVMYKTVGFENFRMDWGSGMWEKTDLGNKALFLGENSSICLVASEFARCKENCIYFTDDYSASNCDGYWGNFDLGVFNLVDGSVEPLVSCPRSSRTGLRWPPPIWVTPNPL